MSNLREITKNIQRHVGTTPDGIYGPITAAAVWAELSGRVPSVEKCGLDERSLGIIRTLDPKAHAAFTQFLCLAKATAATLGCDYIFISGNRSWAEQDALYAQGRTKPGAIVTNAKGGQSNHNFGIAADAGVFLGKIYLDGGNSEQQARAAKVHRACSEHAEACGLEWGGSWKSFKDLPHYEIKTGLTMAQKRELFARKGSVL